ncbi:unnamed protein product [Boreogadus saida]
MVRLRSLDLSSNPLALIHPEALRIPGGPLLELNLSRSLHNGTALTDLTAALRWGGGPGRPGPPGPLREPPGSAAGPRPPSSPTSPACGASSWPTTPLASVRRRGAFAGAAAAGAAGPEPQRLRGVPGPRRWASSGRLGEAARLRLGGNPYRCLSCVAQQLRGPQGGGRRGRAVRLAPRAARRPPPPSAGSAARRPPAWGVRGSRFEGVLPAGEVSLQTSYAFLGWVLGLVGMVSVLVLYLNRKGMKRWVTETREACRDALAGYRHRYEVDADPPPARATVGRVDGVGMGFRFGTAPPPRITADATCDGGQMPADVRLEGTVMAPGR